MTEASRPGVLIQRGWSRREGTVQRDSQIIGHERTPDYEAGDSITGRLYTDDGGTLSYVSDVDGDTMTIWMGEKGSPAVYTGTFSADGNTIEDGGSGRARLQGDDARR